MLGQTVNDIRCIARSLVKQPAFTIGAVATIALGIAANSGIFSIVYGTLFRPLPFGDPDRIVRLWESSPARKLDRANVAVGNFNDWRERIQAFERLSGFVPSGFNISQDGEAERVEGAYVTAGFFATLGVPPLIGQDISIEHEVVGRDDVVVLSFGLWKSRFGASSDTLGKKFILDGRTVTVIGVMPAGFEYPDGSQLWAPAAFPPAQQRNRGARFLRVTGRLNPGVSLQQADEEIKGIAESLAKANPATNAAWSATSAMLHEAIVGDVRQPLLILLGAVVFILLIATVNVGNLMLARSAGRQKEMALRVALGGTRSHLIRLLLTESLMISVCGGALGLLLGDWGRRTLVSVSPDFVPRLNETDVDVVVLGFTAVMSIGIAIIFGMLPVSQATNLNLADVLKEDNRGSTGSARRRRMSSALVVAEVSLAVVTLIGAGLMIRSLIRLEQVDPGFTAERVLTMEVSLAQTKYQEARMQGEFFRQVLERASTVDGIEGASAVSYLPLSNSALSRRFAIDGRPLPQPGEEPVAFYSAIGPDYFKVMGIPLIAGRDFGPQDGPDAPGVTIITQAMARQLWPGEDPLGKRLRFFNSRDPQPPWLSIVGIVGDQKVATLERESGYLIYVPYLQSPALTMSLVVKTRSEPTAAATSVRSIVQSIDFDQPVSKIKAMEDVIADSFSKRRSYTFLLFVLAGIALALAVIGVYGVMTNSIIDRRHEMGVRIAMGAGKGTLLKLIVGQGMLLAAIGTTLGLAASFLLTRLIPSTLLFGIDHVDPPTFAVASGVLICTALLATYLPAQRASKVDPVVVLRGG